MVAALYPAERNSERMSSYPHYTTVQTLISDDIEFPMTLKNIGKRLNNVLMSMVSRNRRFFRCDLRITKGRSMSIYYTCNIREMTISHWSISH